MEPQRWRHVADLYESALEQDPSARDAFLTQATRHDEALRREVESLLAHDQAPVLLDRAVGELAAAVLEADSPLEPGSHLGPYRIERLLGAGGMGEVYLATDTRLQRTVAVKVLSAALGSDPSFRARFDREAQTVASLAHPHICPVYDVGHQDGIAFLVMEHLEGETLAARLERGALQPFDVALARAIEIVDALDAAHRRGIVHRDIKPGNMILTKAGVKLLDFGLARPAAPVLAGASPTGVPNPPPPLTAQGRRFGTLPYMAPEVLDGREADARADLFACGAVLYEMFTGRKAFEGQGEASIIAAIMHEDPPPIAPPLPPLIDRIVRQCLAKDPDQRCQSAHDLRTQLGWLTGPSPLTTTVSPATPGRRRTRRATVAAARLAGVALIALAALRWSARFAPPGPRSVHLAFARPAGTVLSNTGRQVLAISPDGTQVVFVANGRLYRRSLDAAEAAPIEGTQDLAPTTPTFSPDGRWVAFTSAAFGGLKKVRTEGGAPVTLSETESGGNFGATWTADDSILLARDGGVFRVPAGGGASARIFEPRAGEAIYGPQLLPGGGHLLLTVTTAIGPDRWDRGQVITHALDSGVRTVLIDGGADGRYLRTGHLVYAVGSTLFAAPFDVRSLKVGGTPTAVVHGIRRASLGVTTTTGAAHVAISDSGTLAYVPAGGRDATTISLDVRGLATPLASAGPGHFPRLSPDGTRAVTVTDDDSSLWVWPIDGRAAPRRLSVAGPATDPAWTPDGARIAFRAQRNSSWGIYALRADGMGAEERLLAVDGRPSGWSRDGKVLYYVSGKQLWSWRSGGTPQMLPVGGIVRDVSLSPDRRWAAFHANDPQGATAYIQSLVTPGARFQISPDRAHSPLWAPDGKRLFFVTSETNRLMAVDVETAPAVAFAEPVVVAPEIFQTTALRNRNYDISIDGTRLILQVPDRTNAASQQVIVVLNWFEDLKRLVPVP